MQRDNNTTDDLEYMAGLGFEGTATSGEDLDDLVKQVRTRSFSYSSGGYFIFLSLLIGIFLGVTVFFVFYEFPREKATGPAAPVPDNSGGKIERLPPLVQLDTISIAKENFIVVKVKKLSIQNSISPVSSPTYEDSLLRIPSRLIDLQQPVKEEKLKFISNAPVVYIHDMKVTDYTTLYFKKNQFIRLNGTSALYTDKQEVSQGRPQLKQNADYFLHEELGNAMLEFKKEKYDRCISSLNLIATYNPDDVNCDFYLGMCYYYKKNYAKAIPLLDSCISNLNNAFFQEASYYKALSLYESGEKQKALELFKQIAEEGEFYAGKAEKYL